MNYSSTFFPPTKLREGNVFSRVSLSVCLSTGEDVTINHDALDLTVQGPPPPSCTPRHGTSPRLPGTSLYWNPPQTRAHPSTCSNSLNLDLTVQGPLLLTSSGQEWRPVQTCSLRIPPIHTHLHTSQVLTSGGY